MIIIFCLPLLLYIHLLGNLVPTSEKPQPNSFNFPKPRALGWLINDVLCHQIFFENIFCALRHIQLFWMRLQFLECLKKPRIQNLECKISNLECEISNSRFGNLEKSFFEILKSRMENWIISRFWIFQIWKIEFCDWTLERKLWLNSNEGNREGEEIVIEL